MSGADKPGPAPYKTVLVTWLAIFPLVTAVLAIVVPAAILAVLPPLRRLLDPWLTS